MKQLRHKPKPNSIIDEEQLAFHEAEVCQCLQEVSGLD